MTFSQVPAALDLPGLEEDLLVKWRSENLFQKSLELREGNPLWVFYEGPPTANGAPGIHHVWARVFKDLYPRFWSMRGRYVPRRAGWDCHGLPVEIEVERELGFSTKADIEEYGIEAFNQKCKESVQRYVDDWERLTERIGMWIDTQEAYWTMSNEFIESVWWIFSEIWKRGHIYKGSKVVPYCGRCGTALSSHEVAQGYQDVDENSIYVRFEMREKEYDLLAWTTTPWTLISNVALAVGHKIQYVEARVEGGRNLVLARDRAEQVLGEDAEIIREVETGELVGQSYNPPLGYLEIEGAHRVVAADFVSIEEGSGIVHMASSFGEIDREVCEAEGIPTLNPVNAEGKFDDSLKNGGEKYTDVFAIDANKDLIRDLGESVFKVEPYSHSYPHCWRCDTPLIYWAKPTWFAGTSAIRKELLRENAKIGWSPEHIKEGRFGTWLAENVDWALSRDRFWGTPIPIWSCSDCDATECIGSIEELEKLSGKKLTNTDLHRPYIDKVVFPCDKKGNKKDSKKDNKKDRECSGEMRREPSVLDAWFDSGSMPLAQFHFPFGSLAADKSVKKDFFPADFICEAIDQTRGWFYSLLAVNTLASGETPYKNVVCLAHILDEDGLKMSKSRGNVIAPESPIQEHGADALRWYFLADGSPWTPRRMSMEGMTKATRQTLLTLWNTYSFFVTYANIDGWRSADASSAPSVSPAHPAHPVHRLDKWLRSRLAGTIEEVTEKLENFDAFSAAKSIQTFVDDMSNWYIRRSRDRFWRGGDPVIHSVLHEALVGVVRLLAPFCPFLTDAIHRNLSGGQSVHLSDWPELHKGLKNARNLQLEEEVSIVRRFATLGRSARSDAGIKVRKPLKRALVSMPSNMEREVSDLALEDLAGELNVKSVEFAPDLEEMFSYEVRPNFKTLGPRLGEQVKSVAELIRAADGKEMKAAFSLSGKYELDSNGETVTLDPEDVEITAVSHEDLAVSEEAGFSIALDLELTQELLEEGVVRELIRYVNEHRKNSGLNIADRINLEVTAEDWIFSAIDSHSGKLAEEVLAVNLNLNKSSPSGDIVVELTEDGEKAGIKISTLSEKNSS